MHFLYCIVLYARNAMLECIFHVSTYIIIFVYVCHVFMFVRSLYAFLYECFFVSMNVEPCLNAQGLTEKPARESFF